MRRIAQNRWWAFILALSVLIVSSTTHAPASYGSGMDPLEFAGGSPGSSSGGDPDGPAGPSKRVSPGGRVAPGGAGFGLTPVGDGGPVNSVWVWRFHVVLRSLLVRFQRI